ncbi:MAG: 2,3-diaminopropionate biosynthesis protein SbnB [Pyrinomonadaceae bacterium]
MRDGDVTVLSAREVAAALEGREVELLETVRRAYEAHGEGQSSLPHSVFLRFPGEARNRIIGLPAYLGADFGVAGFKWVSSFPGNLARGLDRASAVVVQNSTQTGRPEAILEGSIISGTRTAASAALAARSLRGGLTYSQAGVIGCGYINFLTLRFLLAACPEIEGLVLYDLDPARAAQFEDKCRALNRRLDVRVAADADVVVRECPLVSLATTSISPHLSDLSACRPGGTILHISLRDFTPEVILGCDNVVDDVDHVCREQTSVHLAEQLVGHRDFIRCTLADILRGLAPARRDDDSTVIFSPFGLGVLDLAVSKLTLDLARQAGAGTVIKGFLPGSWVDSSAG